MSNVQSEIRQFLGEKVVATGEEREFQLGDLLVPPSWATKRVSPGVWWEAVREAYRDGELWSQQARSGKAALTPNYGAVISRWKDLAAEKMGVDELPSRGDEERFPEIEGMNDKIREMRRRAAKVLSVAQKQGDEEAAKMAAKILGTKPSSSGNLGKWADVSVVDALKGQGPVSGPDLTASLDDVWKPGEVVTEMRGGTHGHQGSGRSRGLKAWAQVKREAESDQDALYQLIDCMDYDEAVDHLEAITDTHQIDLKMEIASGETDPTTLADKIRNASKWSYEQIGDALVRAVSVRELDRALTKCLRGVEESTSRTVASRLRSVLGESLNVDQTISKAPSTREDIKYYLSQRAFEIDAALQYPWVEDLGIHGNVVFELAVQAEQEMDAQDKAETVWNEMLDAGVVPGYDSTDYTGTVVTTRYGDDQGGVHTYSFRVDEQVYDDVEDMER